MVWSSQSPHIIRLYPEALQHSRELVAVHRNSRGHASLEPKQVQEVEAAIERRSHADRVAVDDDADRFTLLAHQ